MESPIAVSGIGMVTPAGNTTEETWETILSGKSMAAHDDRLFGLSVDFSCAVRDFDGLSLLGRQAARMDIVTQFAMVAAREAVANSGLIPSEWDSSRVAVIVGNSFGGPATYEREHANYGQGDQSAVSPRLMVSAPSNMNSGYLAIDLSARGPNFTVSTACASGATAIGLAMTLIRSGQCDVAVAGGTESFLTPTTIASLANLGAMSLGRQGPESASRPFDRDRDGFVAGEGAAFLVLESVEHAARRGATPIANMLGYGSTADAFHASAPDPEGTSVKAAISAAIRQSGIDRRQVSHVNAHGTATKKNDSIESSVIREMYSSDVAVASTKGSIGHLIGAAGAAEAAFALLAIRDDVVPPTANLTNIDPEFADLDIVMSGRRPMPVDFAASHSFGFGGQNAVLVAGKS